MTLTSPTISYRAKLKTWTGKMAESHALCAKSYRERWDRRGENSGFQINRVATTGDWLPDEAETNMTDRGYRHSRSRWQINRSERKSGHIHDCSCCTTCQTEEKVAHANNFSDSVNSLTSVQARPHCEFERWNFPLLAFYLITIALYLIQSK